MNEISVSQSLVNKLSQNHREVGFLCGIFLICWDSPVALLSHTVGCSLYTVPVCGPCKDLAHLLWVWKADQLLWNGLFPGKSWSCAHTVLLLTVVPSPTPRPWVTSAQSVRSWLLERMPADGAEHALTRVWRGRKTLCPVPPAVPVCLECSDGAGVEHLFGGWSSAYPSRCRNLSPVPSWQFLLCPKTFCPMETSLGACLFLLLVF